jgi:mRNA interferase RelE/StbE
MKYRVEILPDAEKTLTKLDKPIRKRIIKFLSEYLPNLENPRSIGEPLKGNFTEFWRYRRGDFRIICKIEGEHLLILVIRIGNRKDVYR